MDILIKTLKDKEQLQVALDKAAALPLDKDDNWPYVLEQPSERFVYVKKYGAIYRIGLYKKGIGFRPVLRPYNMRARSSPIDEFIGDVTFTENGAMLKVKLRPSFWVAPGIIALLMLIPAFISVNTAIFSLLFLGGAFLLQKPELKKGREYFIERVTEYLNSL